MKMCRYRSVRSQAYVYMFPPCLHFSLKLFFYFVRPLQFNCWSICHKKFFFLFWIHLVFLMDDVRTDVATTKTKQKTKCSRDIVKGHCKCKYVHLCWLPCRQWDIAIMSADRRKNSFSPAKSKTKICCVSTVENMHWVEVSMHAGQKYKDLCSVSDETFRFGWWNLW